MLHAHAQDPLREDVSHAIAQCQRAGICVRMLTGDNARTAASIAVQSGILSQGTDIDGVVADAATLTAAARTWHAQQASALAGAGVSTVDGSGLAPSRAPTSMIREAVGAVVAAAGPGASTSSGSGSSFGDTTLKEASSRVGLANGVSSSSSYLVDRASAVMSPSQSHWLRQLPSLPGVLVVEGQQLRSMVIGPDGRLDEYAFRCALLNPKPRMARSADSRRRCMLSSSAALPSPRCSPPPLRPVFLPPFAATQLQRAVAKAAGGWALLSPGQVPAGHGPQDFARKVGRSGQRWQCRRCGHGHTWGHAAACRRRGSGARGGGNDR
eukprot:351225-Chlamydomonas_euryale.AAC.3